MAAAAAANSGRIPPVVMHRHKVAWLCEDD